MDHIREVFCHYENRRTEREKHLHSTNIEEMKGDRKWLLQAKVAAFLLSEACVLRIAISVL